MCRSVDVIKSLGVYSIHWFSGLSGLSGLFGWVNGLLSYWVNSHWVIGSYYVSTGDHKVKSFTT